MAVGVVDVFGFGGSLRRGSFARRAPEVVPRLPEHAPDQQAGVHRALRAREFELYIESGKKTQEQLGNYEEISRKVRELIE